MLLFYIIITQVIIFGAVIYTLKRLMQGDTESAVSRLNQSYSEINKKKEELVTKIQQIEEEYQKRKEEAEKVAIKLRDEAEEEISQKRDATLKKARDDAETIIAEATGAKDRIREEVKNEEKLIMIDYCKELIELIFSDSLKGSFSDLLIENFFKDFNDIDTSHIPTDIEEVEVISSFPLSEDMKSKFLENVNKKIKTKVKIKKTIDRL